MRTQELRKIFHRPQPGVDQPKVEQIRERLVRGDYQVDSESVAEELLREHILFGELLDPPDASRAEPSEQESREG